MPSVYQFCLLLSEFVVRKLVVKLERRNYEYIPTSDVASESSDAD